AANGRLRAHLAGQPDADLAAVAATLQSGRQAFAYRRAVVAETVAAAVAALDAPAPAAAAVRADKPPPVVFLFPGQGSQRPGAGRELYEREPAFRGIVDAAAAVLPPLVGRDVRELLVSASVADAEIEDTA